MLLWYVSYTCEWCPVRPSPNHSWYTWQPGKSRAETCQELSPARPSPKRDWPTLAQQRIAVVCPLHLCVVSSVSLAGTQHGSLASPALKPVKS